MAGKQRKITDPRQLSFDFVEPYKYDVELVGMTPHGYGLFRRQNEVGGFTYFTDQYGVGYMCYDPLTDLISTFAAMVHDDPEHAKAMYKHLATVFDFDK